MSSDLRSAEHEPKQTASTGIAGLDVILNGGLPAQCLYLIEGVPGAGKTTLALQFLLEGVRRGETVLYCTLSETEQELRNTLASHGWDGEGILIRDLVPSEELLHADDQYTIFHPSEVELGETMKAILDDFERSKPSRIVIDSLSELRLLAGTPLRYRRQVLAFKKLFTGKSCTVVLLDDLTGADHDLQVQSIVHGVIRLEQLYPEYGAERRRLMVLKLRGVPFRGGFHDYIIRTGGLEVYPRLSASYARTVPQMDRLPSGNPELDALLGGGIERGTSTLIVGAAGTGKSSLASLFVESGAAGGQRAEFFVFDESVHTLLTRSSGIGIDLQPRLESGAVRIRQVDPAEMSPGEFANSIQRSVRERGVSMIVIDSLNGYLNAMPGERFLIIQLHELLTFLGQHGVATILIGAHQGLIGSNMTSPVDASYLADTVILMRYFELRGEVRQAISIMKKRGSAHERSLREFQLGGSGVTLGPPLRRFRGVLTGIPVLESGEADTSLCS